MKIILERQIKFAFALALLLLLAIGFFAYRSISSLNKTIRWEQRTREVLLEIDETLYLIINAETSGRGFVLTADESFLTPYSQAAQTLDVKIKHLQNLVADNAVQTENTKKLENLAKEKLDFIKRTIEVRQAQGFAQSLEEIKSNRGKTLMDEIRRLAFEMKEIEKNLLISREADLDKSLKTASQTLFLGSLIGILSLGLANFAIFRETAKRRGVEIELREANKELETRVEKRTEELSEKNVELEEQVRQREQNDSTLRQSENFARAILDSLPAQIAVVDKDGKIVEVNQAWQNFAGTNGVDKKLLSSSIGQNYLEICAEASGSEADAPFVGKNLKAVLSGEKSGFSFEYPCHAPQQERWFLMQVSAMHDTGGGAVIAHTNITDRKKAEIKLKNSEEFNRSIFENSPDCINILELDGTFHSMNTKGLSLMEIEDAESLEGKLWIDYWEGDEKELAYQAVQTALRGKTRILKVFAQRQKKVRNGGTCRSRRFLTRKENRAA